MGGGCTYLRYNIVDPCSKLKDFNSGRIHLELFFDILPLICLLKVWKISFELCSFTVSLSIHQFLERNCSDV